MISTVAEKGQIVIARSLVSLAVVVSQATTASCGINSWCDAGGRDAVATLSVL